MFLEGTFPFIILRKTISKQVEFHKVGYMLELFLTFFINRKQYVSTNDTTHILSKKQKQ